MGDYKSVSFERREGSYDWCHSNEKQAQYIFYFNSFAEEAAKLGFNKVCGGFDIPLEDGNRRDFYNNELEELIYDLEEHYRRSYGTTADKVKKLVELFEIIQEDNKKLFFEDMINKCDSDISELNKKKELYVKKLNELLSE